jgi:hypothetical protein
VNARVRADCSHMNHSGVVGHDQVRSGGARHVSEVQLVRVVVRHINTVSSHRVADDAILEAVDRLVDKSGNDTLLNLLVRYLHDDLGFRD